HGYFGCHQHLALGAAQAFRKGCGGHGGRYAYFRLAAAHSGGNGGTLFKNAAYFGGGEQELDDPCGLVAIAKGDIILQHSGNYAGCAIGGSGHYPAKRGIFFIYGQRKAAYPVQRIGKVVTPAADRGDPGGKTVVSAALPQALVERGSARRYPPATPQRPGGLATPDTAL